jgi:hypothetical protein
MSFVAVAVIGGAVIGAGTSIYEGSQTQKAIKSDQDLLNNLTYQPIDIPSLQAAATQASITDAQNSLALQTALQPNVVKANNETAASIAGQIAQGGNLGSDISDQVEEAGRTAGGATGNLGNAAPYTAGLIGTNALALLQQRQNAGLALGAANPAPAVGLSAQDVASATEANSNAINQFNIAKAGGQANLINSQAQANSALAGGIGSSLTQAASLLALTNSSKGSGSTTVVNPGASGTGVSGPVPATTSGSNIGGFS